MYKTDQINSEDKLDETKKNYRAMYERERYNTDEEYKKYKKLKASEQLKKIREFYKIMKELIITDQVNLPEDKKNK